MDLRHTHTHTHTNTHTHTHTDLRTRSERILLSHHRSLFRFLFHLFHHCPCFSLRKEGKAGSGFFFFPGG